VERYSGKAYTTIYPSAYTSGNEAYRHKRTSTPSLTFKKGYYENQNEGDLNPNEGRSTQKNCDNQVHRQERNTRGTLRRHRDTHMPRKTPQLAAVWLLRYVLSRINLSGYKSLLKKIRY
jgi:hypothetical protein